MSKKRVAIFIDGSNLYFKLKTSGVKNILKFNYRQLSKWLTRNRKIVYAGYYVGVIRAKTDDKKGQKLRRGQINLFNFLQSKSQQFIIRKGYIMHNDGVYHEKGVDVQLAVDILIGAYENSYDTAIVISSDTDLIPAIEKAKKLGKEIEHIGFAHQPSFAMQRHATLSRLLIKEELKPFANHEIQKNINRQKFRSA